MTDTTTTVTSVEQLKGLVGQETRVGDWHLVTQEEINHVRRCHGDHNGSMSIPSAPGRPVRARSLMALDAVGRAFIMRGGQACRSDCRVDGIN